MSTDMLSIRNLDVHFPISKGQVVRAVDGVTLSLKPGETVGLVGESGSGKTTVGKTVLRLVEATAGEIDIDGLDVRAAGQKGLKALRRKAQIIFQDPHSSLNPRMTIRRAVAEGLILNTSLRGNALREKVAEMLIAMGLPPQFHDRFPHELSGGQKQRVCIARALVLEPDLLVLDEPTSALDVSVQAQILGVLKDLRLSRPRLTQLFISHNLAVIRFLCDRVAVMYLGKIVEEGPVAEVFGDPRHPYTRALLSAVPVPSAVERPERLRLTGDIPSPANVPKGCAFHTRCPIAKVGVCDTRAPEPVPLGSGRQALCHFADQTKGSLSA
ncbi:ABC transporter ATP-binding protein [Vannielia litorea]|uniref:ABC transporter ATP-binding protein n=1 Tax=Vannielia litorea TaxID=1217970 RepID=UPI001C989EBC|nr:ABC transporter ATP-binding protein [Vannielia litorea]MBY6048725.1 ABC transporter ATP-binding protein [Vannielia litorea]MBY6076139.1 ABC transporter ATP-binding protein [Vannielia litorea]